MQRNHEEDLIAVNNFFLERSNPTHATSHMMIIFMIRY
jgi:hypothetical protein